MSLPRTKESADRRNPDFSLKTPIVLSPSRNIFVDFFFAFLGVESTTNQLFRPNPKVWVGRRNDLISARGRRDMSG